jgi:hypothetical protein
LVGFFFQTGYNTKATETVVVVVMSETVPLGFTFLAEQV